MLNRLPHPVLEALNVSYRRIPTRDIYCDTRLIIKKCEALLGDGRLGAATPH